MDPFHKQIFEDGNLVVIDSIKTKNINGAAKISWLQANPQKQQKCDWLCKNTLHVRTQILTYF